MTDLSPAAQAVLDAVLQKSNLSPTVPVAAAALRAAADQGGEFDVPFNVVDDWEKIKGSCASFYAAAEWGYNQALSKQRAIAAELEGASG